MCPETHQDVNLTPSPAGVASVPTVDAAAVLESHRRTTLRRIVWEDADGLLWRGWRQFAEPACERCGQPWLGDAATGGCAAVLLARRVALLEGLLREVEWGGIQMDRALDNDRLLLERACPSCGRGRSKSHGPDCRLAAALADGG